MLSDGALTTPPMFLFMSQVRDLQICTPQRTICKFPHLSICHRPQVRNYPSLEISLQLKHTTLFTNSLQAFSLIVHVTRIRSFGIEVQGPNGNRFATTRVLLQGCLQYQTHWSKCKCGDNCSHWVTYRDQSSAFTRLLAGTNPCPTRQTSKPSMVKSLMDNVKWILRTMKTCGKVLVV